jgi:hypothetical protein
VHNDKTWEANVDARLDAPIGLYDENIYDTTKITKVCQRLSCHGVFDSTSLLLNSDLRLSKHMSLVGEIRNSSY